MGRLSSQYISSVISHISLLFYFHINFNYSHSYSRFLLRPQIQQVHSQRFGNIIYLKFQQHLISRKKKYILTPPPNTSLQFPSNHHIIFNNTFVEITIFHLSHDSRSVRRVQSANTLLQLHARDLLSGTVQLSLPTVIWR